MRKMFHLEQRAPAHWTITYEYPMLHPSQQPYDYWDLGFNIRSRICYAHYYSRETTHAAIKRFLQRGYENAPRIDFSDRTKPEGWTPRNKLK